MQTEDQRARYFHFRKQRTELNWQAISGVDVDYLVVGGGWMCTTW